MKVVEPIRDTDDIERIKDFLRRKNERRLRIIPIWNLYRFTS